MAAYIGYDQDRGDDRLVRDLVMEFRGLSGSAKSKAVLDDTGMTRANLSSLANGDGMKHTAVAGLLTAMKANCKEVKPSALGVIGKDHLRQRFVESGCDEKTFHYTKMMDIDEGVPVVNNAIQTVLEGAEEAAERHTMPETLEDKLREQLTDDPIRAWDKIVAAEAKAAVDAESDVDDGPDEEVL